MHREACGIDLLFYGFVLPQKCRNYIGEGFTDFHKVRQIITLVYLQNSADKITQVGNWHLANQTRKKVSQYHKLLCAFCLPYKLGGLGWSKSDFDATDIETIQIVYNEAVERSEEMNAKMSGKPKQKSLPEGFKLPGER